MECFFSRTRFYVPKVSGHAVSRATFALAKASFARTNFPLLFYEERSAAVEGAAASGAEEGQTGVGEEDASRGARATRTRRLTRRARADAPCAEMQTRFGTDALHVAGKKKTRLRRRNASRGWVGGRRRAVVGPPARGGKRGGDVPGRNTCAISRHLSSARSNGRNDLPRPDKSDETVVFFCLRQKAQILPTCPSAYPRFCSTFQNRSV